jgi:hypothetical protein
MPIWLIIVIIVAVAWHVQATRLCVRAELEGETQHYKTYQALVADLITMLGFFPLAWICAVIYILNNLSGDPNTFAAKIAQPRRVRNAAKLAELERKTGFDK